MQLPSSPFKGKWCKNSVKSFTTTRNACRRCHSFRGLRMDVGCCEKMVVWTGIFSRTFSAIMVSLCNFLRTWAWFGVRCRATEPGPRGLAQRPSPCGSGLCNFPSLRSPFPGCRPRIGCREWVEGQLWWGFLWGKHCPDRDLLCNQRSNLKRDFYFHIERRGHPAW